MVRIGSHMKRIAPLTILFAALFEFGIERARFDLWIVTLALVIVLATAAGEALVSRAHLRRRDHDVSVYSGNSR